VLRLRQERSGFVQLGTLTVGQFSQSYELGVERPSFLLLTG